MGTLEIINLIENDSGVPSILGFENSQEGPLIKSLHRPEIGSWQLVVPLLSLQWSIRLNSQRTLGKMLLRGMTSRRGRERMEPLVVQKTPETLVNKGFLTRQRIWDFSTNGMKAMGFSRYFDRLGRLSWDSKKFSAPLRDGASQIPWDIPLSAVSEMPLGAILRASTLRRRSLDYSSRRHRAFIKHDDSRSTSASEY